jgi:hypothetical protein
MRTEKDGIVSSSATDERFAGSSRMRLVGGGSEADPRERRSENVTEEWSSVLALGQREDIV